MSPKDADGLANNEDPDQTDRLRMKEQSDKCQSMPVFLNIKALFTYMYLLSTMIHSTNSMNRVRP